MRVGLRVGVDECERRGKTTTETDSVNPDTCHDRLLPLRGVGATNAFHDVDVASYLHGFFPHLHTMRKTDPLRGLLPNTVTVDMADNGCNVRINRGPLPHEVPGMTRIALHCAFLLLNAGATTCGSSNMPAGNDGSSCLDGGFDLNDIASLEQATVYAVYTVYIQWNLDKNKQKKTRPATSLQARIAGIQGFCPFGQLPGVGRSRSFKLSLGRDMHITLTTSSSTSRRRSRPW